MKTKPFLIILSLCIFTLSCNKEKADLRLSDLEIPIITGFEMRTDCGDIYMTYGNPNIKLGNKANYNESDYYMVAFPNPSCNYCYLNIKSPNPNEIKSLWVVPALYQGSSLNSNYLGSNTAYAGGMPLIQAEFSYSGFMIDFTNFPSGFYRVYLKMGGEIYYDNLYVSKELCDNEY